MPEESGWTVQARYPITCPKCGKEITAAPSMAMGLGMNMGCGYHKECETSFRIHLVPGAWGEPIGEQPTGMLAELYEEATHV